MGFIVFFEFCLLPLVFFCLFKGSYLERFNACIYFFLFRIFSSLPFLVGLFYIYSFVLRFWFYYYRALFGSFSAFLLFSPLVKLPIFGFHYWLPKLHVERRTFGRIFLAGLLIKISGYLFLRLGVLYRYFYNYLLTLRLYRCLFVRLYCLRQFDIKVLIAYSSICHICFGFRAYCRNYRLRIIGFFFILISHGVCSSILFFLAGNLSEVLGSRSFLFLKFCDYRYRFFLVMWGFSCFFNARCPLSINILREILLGCCFLRYRFYILLVLFFCFFFMFVYRLLLFVYLSSSCCFYRLLCYRFSSNFILPRILFLITILLFFKCTFFL